MVLKLLLSLLLSVLLLGCATNSAIPTDYHGDVITLWDNVNKISSTNAHFFELIEVNGRRIATSSAQTRDKSFKIGFAMTAIPLSREIPLNTQILYIGGFNYLAADLFGLGDTLYRVKGKVEVHLEQGKTYIVNGELKHEYALVWLEEEKTGIIVSDIVVEGDVSADYLAKLRADKIAVHTKSITNLSLKEENNRKLLGRASTQVTSTDCKDKSALETSVADIYLMAEALFKNRQYQESATCFIRISESSEIPREAYGYLFLIYDIGLGVAEDPTLAKYWLDRYDSVENN